MKLSSLRPNNPTASLKLVHPLGLPCDVTLQLISRETGEAKAYSQIVQDRRLRELSKKGRITATSQEIEEDTVEILARCIQSWTGLTDDIDQPLPCTMENKKELLAEKWVFKQVDEFVNEDSNFFKLP